MVVDMVNDETVMPDGRPLFAWWNEILMARSQAATTKQMWNDARAVSAILGLDKVVRSAADQSGDLVIRITRKAIMESESLNDEALLASAEVRALNGEEK